MAPSHGNKVFCATVLCLFATCVLIERVESTLRYERDDLLFIRDNFSMKTIPTLSFSSAEIVPGESCEHCDKNTTR